MFDRWAGRRGKFGLAFGEDFLLAVRRKGRHRDGKLETRRLSIPPDLITVSPLEPNIRAASTLAQIAAEALEPFQAAGGEVAVALPDLAVRVFVFPSKLQAEEIRSRIGPRLAYPRDEARIDTWRAPAGWMLVAAIRGVVLRQYEQILEALGCRVIWADAASLIPIPDWTREGTAGDGTADLRIHVQLYSRHYTLCVMRKADMLDVRTKLRGPADEDRIAIHLFRVPSLFEAGDDMYVSVHGMGAPALVEHLRAGGLSPERIQSGSDDEEAHLGSLLEVLLRRL